MQYPDFIKSFHGLDAPFSSDVVEIHAVRSERGLVCFFNFLQETVLPPHSHKDQWGTVVVGSIDFTIGGVTKTFAPGDSYFIPAGVEHGAKITAGTKVIDVFEEPDRYALVE